MALPSTGARSRPRSPTRRQQALAAGGLFVLGTERHESRRIDNQLRGRTGRQGDPGHSKFFLSCEDDLLRIFAGERLDAIMRTFGVAGRRGDHPQVAELAPSPPPRSKVEQRNYEIRKNLLKYDDVVNDQRKAVFEQRQEFMEADDLSDVVAEMRRDTIDDLVSRHLPPKAYAEQWDVEGLDERVQEHPRPGAADRRLGGRGRHRQRGDRASASSRPPTRAPPSARR